MNQLLQSGLHPDAEALNAFAEGALPAHERTATLAHLADCATCREIVFLAQQAAPVPAPAAAAAWRGWLHSTPLFGVGIGVAALAGLALIFVTLHSRPSAAPAVAVRRAETIQPPALGPATKSATPAQPQPHPAPPAISHPAPRPLPKMEPPMLSAVPRPMMPNRGFLSAGSGAGIGAGIGRAPTVTLAAPARSMSMRSVQGDAAPQAIITPTAPQPPTVNLAAGVPAPTATPAVPPPPASGATTNGIDAPLPSAAETVTVQNADQALSMDSATLSTVLPGAAAAKKRALRPTSPAAPLPGLPSKLPTAYLVSSGARTLATDATGALFLSLDAGRHWQPVDAAWPGKVAQLKLAHAPAVFQLLTTTGAVWLSPDGIHWQPQ